jgi:hypothetical protein
VKNIVEVLWPLNCAYNCEPTPDGICFSKDCMFNQDPQVAKDIAEKGCRVFKSEPVFVELKKIPDDWKEANPERKGG